MKLLTEVHIDQPQFEIGYDDKIFLIGSCFTDNIGMRFENAFFRTTRNPFGVMYNPMSIARCIEILADQRSTLLEEKNFVQHNGLFHSWLHHGSFSKADRHAFEESIQESIANGKKALQEADIVIITFGTAWVYKYEGMIVSNCHKLPANQFTRERLNVEQIVTTYKELLSSDLFRNKKVIFTVSPIRHIKDGLHENQISKATLLLAIQQLVKQEVNQQAQIFYFPSYEIMLDELRDYRFYDADMCHPSQTATDYIWERFTNTFMNAHTQQDMHLLQALHKDLQHRALHTDSDEYKRFVERTQQKRSELIARFPWI